VAIGNRKTAFARKSLLGLACAGLMLGFCIAGSGAALAQAHPDQPGSAEAQAACTPDVFRLCSSDIPNVPAIITCMKRQRSQLSRECRSAMAHEQPRAVAHRVHHRGADRRRVARDY
jgi:hypothetical protein